MGRSTRGLAAGWAVVLVLAGCGSEDAGARDPSGSPATSPSASSPSAKAGHPDCSVVWVAGADIPRSYRGCNSPSGFVPGDVLGCSSGQRMVRFDDRFYGVTGGTVREAESSLQDDLGYRDAVASCRG